MTFKKIILNKLMLIAMVIAVVYQVAMIGIYIGGYKYTADRPENSKIIYVNQDGDKGKDIVKSMKNALDFASQDEQSLTKAKAILRNHKAALVINIPENYTEDMAQGKAVKLNYFYNSAGDTISKQTGTTVANQLTNKLNLAVSSQKMQAILVKSMMEVSKPQIEADIKKAVGTDPTKLDSIQKTVTAKYQERFTQMAKNAVNLNSVSENSKDINPKPTSQMNLIMTPMIAPVSSYIGAMISSIILYSFVFKKAIRSNVSHKWLGWLALEVDYLLISLAVGGAGALMLAWINHFNQEVTFKLLGILTLNTFVSFQLILAIYMLLGAVAFLVTLPLTLAQVVTAGTMIPEYLMAPALKAIRPYLPVSSSWQLIQNIIFKTSTDTDPLMSLMMIAGVTMVISLIILPIRYHKNADPRPDIDVLSLL
ncbi:YhgE/Pip domain-containing protein [Streptococcus halotolerans]|uniref:YhgE/Pip domain-containing protein n=1 Tax=Streptococcus halotolerans TaxID=1814128 RepID=UPI000787248C|nr:ABC transporter permease [Streptococcus halotolerans]